MFVSLPLSTDLTDLETRTCFEMKVHVVFNFITGIDRNEIILMPRWFEIMQVCWTFLLQNKITNQLKSFKCIRLVLSAQVFIYLFFVTRQ